jgi:general stress protein YciG
MDDKKKQTDTETTQQRIDSVRQGVIIFSRPEKTSRLCVRRTDAMKEHIPIREPKQCIEPGCDQPAKRRERCMKHYQRLRYWEMKLGTWEPQPCGNFGDPEGHTISARMGGSKRAEDREGLSEAGKIGARKFAENHPEGRSRISSLGGKKIAEDREHMSQMGKKGNEVRWGKRSNKEADDGTANF